MLGLLLWVGLRILLSKVWIGLERERENGIDFLVRKVENVDVFLLLLALRDGLRMEFWSCEGCGCRCVY